LTIAIDFDGVIHRYSKGWQGGNIYDPLVKKAFYALHTFLDAKHLIFIFSSRSPEQIKEWFDTQPLSSYYPFSPPFITQIVPPQMKFWKEFNVVGITNRKLPADLYIDDRAYRFEGDWDLALEEIKRKYV